MEVDDDGPSLEEIGHWKVPALKDFLRVRGLKTTGRKAELQALVYSAVQHRTPVKPDEIAEDRARSVQYAELLKVDGKKLPDPLSDLTEGWLKEKDAVKQWPPVGLTDIAKWLLCEAPCVSEPRRSGSGADRKATTLHDRLLSDYKEGKAFSYFESKWINEVHYHPISADSDACFLKATCTPSQSIRNIPHAGWVAVEKKSGRILSAYCSCFAGLGSTCNHIAALLFKLDHAFMVGASRPCTSKECTWNVYSGASAAVLEAKPIHEMEWAKPNYHKGANRAPINKVSKKLFDPLQNTRSTPTTAGLLNAMFPSCQESTLFKYMSNDISPPATFPPEADFNLGPEMEVDTTVESAPPPSLSEMADSSSEETVQSFLDKLPRYTTEQVATVELQTRGQAENKQWATFRSGMITASILKSVVTRNNTLHDETSTLSKDPQPMIKTVMGYTQLDPNNPNLKYGRLLEPVARDKYTALQEKRHKNLKVAECGLFVHPQKVFLGATPDGLVECDCCGEGLLEVKCPRTAATEQPADDNTKFLHLSEDGIIQLNKNHAYYFQVQAQMGVTGRRWCDFYVYSKVGYHLERIHFKEDVWMGAVVAAEQFFNEYVAPELVHRKIRDNNNTKTSL
ncbi:uncharacterized protein LOC144902231 [Branchiostoma floridae x Branchiostoma belcheri]